MSRIPGSKRFDKLLILPEKTLRFTGVAGVLCTVLLFHNLSLSTQRPEPQTDDAGVTARALTPASFVVKPQPQWPLALPDDVSEQLAKQAAIHTVSPPLYTDVVTLSAAQTLHAALRERHFDDPALIRQLFRAAPVRDTQVLNTFSAGTEIQLNHIWRAGQRPHITRLTANIGDSPSGHVTSRVVIERKENDRLSVSQSYRKSDDSWLSTKGVIKDGFFSSMQRAKVPPSVVADVVRLFEGKVDFRKGFRVGDAFTVIYQRPPGRAAPPAGNPVVIGGVGGIGGKVGRVLAVEFQSQGKWHRAVWHHPSEIPRSKTQKSVLAAGYYTFEGRSLDHSQWVHPLRTGKVTSLYGTRVHPISGRRHRHDGVDLAAPHGTQIVAAAKGTVTFVGWRAGYGKLLVIRHSPRHATYYGHLSAFSAAARAGGNVAPGTPIGRVGSTGDATGPHLHFEVRRDEQPINPMFALRSGPMPMTREQRLAFRRSTQALLAQLARMRNG